MVIDDFDIHRFAIHPLKANAILSIDPQTVLACPIPLQRLKAQSWQAEVC